MEHVELLQNLGLSSGAISKLQMLPSNIINNNNINGSGGSSSSSHDPIFLYNYTDQATLNFHKHNFITTDHTAIANTPNSKPQDHYQDPFFSFLNLPPLSPLIHYDDVFLQQYQDLLLLHQPPSMINNSTQEETEINKMDSSKKTDQLTKKKTNYCASETVRKRSSKKDRHSKINTAQGPRDRRMRLSLEIARQFFGLQDMLGFDKPSKTVEWLLTKAKSEIKKLAKARGYLHLIDEISNTNNGGGAAKSSSSTNSECEVLSGIDDSTVNGQEKSEKFVNKEKRVRIRQLRKAAFQPRARESREKARERARERTIEKKWSKSLNGQSRQLTAKATTNHEELNLVGSNWSPFRAGEDSGSQSQNMRNNPSLEVLAEVDEPSSHPNQGLATTMDVGAVTMNNWSPSSISNYLPSTTEIFPEHQFGDYQFYGKQWEAYNNQGL